LIDSKRDKYSIKITSYYPSPLSLTSYHIMSSSSSTPSLPSTEIDLPTGTLGIAFRGNEKATVSAVLQQSPLQGKVKSGYVADRLTLGDGRTYKDVNSQQLANALAESSSDCHRKLRMMMGYPEELIVTVPYSYRNDIIIMDDVDNDNKPTITSTTLPELRVGMFVFYIQLRINGFSLLCGSSKEIMEVLTASNVQGDRIIVMKDPLFPMFHDKFLVRPVSDDVVNSQLVNTDSRNNNCNSSGDDDLPTLFEY